MLERIAKRLVAGAVALCAGATCAYAQSSLTPTTFGSFTASLPFATLPLGATDVMVINQGGLSKRLNVGPAGGGIFLLNNGQNAVLPNALNGLGIGPSSTPTYALNAAGINVAGPTTLNGLFFGIGNIGGGVPIPSSLYGSAKCVWGWNKTNGGGETDLICDKDGGSEGGFHFYDTDAGAPRSLAQLSGTNGLTIPDYANFNQTYGAPAPPTGVGGVSVYKTGTSPNDTTVSGHGYATTAGNSAEGGYFVGDARHGAGVTTSIATIEANALNFTSVDSNSVGTAGSGFLPAYGSAIFSSGGPSGTDVHVANITCSDPGFASINLGGCTLGFRIGLSGLFPAPFIVGEYMLQGASSYYSAFYDAGSTGGLSPANTMMLRNAGNLSYMTAITVVAGGTGYYITEPGICKLDLTGDTNAGFHEGIVVDTVSAPGGAVLTAHIAIPGTSAVPAGTYAAVSTTAHGCGPNAGGAGTQGSGATFNAQFSQGSILDLQAMATQVAANPVFRVLDHSNVVQMEITQAGFIGVGGVPSLQLDIGGSTSAQRTGAMSNERAFIGDGASTHGGVILGAGANGNTPSVAASFDTSASPLAFEVLTNGAVGIHVDTSQNVGINTTLTNLSSLGNTVTLNTATAGNYAAYELASNATFRARLAANNTGTFLTSTAAVALQTNGATSLYIDQNQNVAVNTTSTNLSGLGNTLTVNTATAGNYAVYELASNGVLRGRFAANNTEAFLTSQTALALQTNGSTLAVTFTGANAAFAGLAQTATGYNGAGGSAIPTCNSGAAGSYALVTDGKASPTAGSNYAAADGAAKQAVWCNGANWLYLM